MSRSFRLSVRAHTLGYERSIISQHQIVTLRLWLLEVYYVVGRSICNLAYLLASAGVGTEELLIVSSLPFP